ncbi:hypothetical protein ACFQZ2_16185 [Streptomonospora algeriensis]|uniref:RanBP2-type domain-containing protein n=1 Tax=Streptomonospora algeriensis TaxID=995084 RepID=A0ABW3BJC4_9ACTN
MEPDTRTDRRVRAWDCRLCTRANKPAREVCGYCGNPRAANHTLPPLPWCPETPRPPHAPGKAPDPPAPSLQEDRPVQLYRPRTRACRVRPYVLYRASPAGRA